MRKDVFKGILIGFLVFVGIASILTSCVRERDINTEISRDQVMGQFIYTNAIDIADDAARKNTGDLLGNFKSRGYCATLVHDKLSSPRTISINFGNTNCLCNDGRRRNGIIQVSYTGNNYKDPGSSVEITFKDYTVDGYQVFGLVGMNNEGLNENNVPYYDLNVQGSMLKPLVLDTLTWTAKQLRIHLKGSSTAQFDDDLYQYIGSSNGQNEYKVFYACNIVKPLMKYPDCRYFKEGLVEQQPQGHALRSINYGDEGAGCDDDATILFNTKAYNIDL